MSMWKLQIKTLESCGGVKEGIREREIRKITVFVEKTICVNWTIESITLHQH